MLSSYFNKQYREKKKQNRYICSEKDDGHWPRFLSRVFVNWLSAGGTFRRWFSTRRCLCILTYLGHFTNLCRSLFGGRAPPIPNCFGRFSNKGFATFVAFSGTCSSNWADQTTNTHTHTPTYNALIDNNKCITPICSSHFFNNKAPMAHLFLLHRCRDSRLESTLLGSLRDGKQKHIIPCRFQGLNTL